GPSRVLRLRAGEETAGRLGMPPATGLFRRTIGQAREHGDVLAEGFQRLEYAREREIPAGRFRLPLVHDDAVGNVYHRQAADLVRGSGPRGTHGVERRKSNGGADTPQQSAA